jgi:hypothetical protein
MPMKMIFARFLALMVLSGCTPRCVCTKIGTFDQASLTRPLALEFDPLVPFSLELCVNGKCTSETFGPNVELGDASTQDTDSRETSTTVGGAASWSMPREWQWNSASSDSVCGGVIPGVPIRGHEGCRLVETEGRWTLNVNWIVHGPKEGDKFHVALRQSGAPLLVADAEAHYTKFEINGPGCGGNYSAKL